VGGSCARLKGFLEKSKIIKFVNTQRKIYIYLEREG